MLAGGWSAARAAGKPVLILEPATGGHKVGTTWTVKLMIDAAGERVSVADAKLTYDPGLLQVVSVVAGDYFDGSSQDIDNQNGVMYWGGYFVNVAQTSTAETGTLATLTLSAKGTGVAGLAFVCASGETNDSNILNGANEDVIDCASLIDGSYDLTGDGGDSQPDSDENNRNTDADRGGGDADANDRTAGFGGVGANSVGTCGRGFIIVGGIGVGIIAVQLDE